MAVINKSHKFQQTETTTLNPIIGLGSTYYNNTSGYLHQFPNAKGSWPIYYELILNLILGKTPN